LAAFVFATFWEKKINKFKEHPEKKYYKQYYGTIGLAVFIAFLLIFVPDWNTKILNNANEYAVEKVNEINFFTPDELAYKLLHNYTDIEIIDLRSAEKFKKDNIPSSINLPFNEITEKEWYDYIRKNQKTLVFYSDNDEQAKKAYFVAKQFGHDYNAVLEGGFNKFNRTIMHFTPADITDLNSIQGQWNLRFRKKAKQELIELKKKFANKNKPKKKTVVRVVGGC
jgi:rhodanese-related sulfurtransferase